jgi:general secretion pathway protein G
MIRRDEQQRQNRKRNAFTLMEMLVVVAIIVALAGMGGFFFINQLNASKISTTKIQCAKWVEACEAYYIQNGTYPTDVKQLTKPSGKSGEHPAIMKPDAPILDPGGNEYQIVAGSDGVPPKVISQWLQSQPQAQQK